MPLSVCNANSVVAWQAPGVEQVHQPGRGVAAVEQKDAAGVELVQRVGQHGALGLAGRMHGRMQGQLGAGQVQREQALIRR